LRRRSLEIFRAAIREALALAAHARFLRDAPAGI
jgi:hypothetical protein